MDKMTVVIPAAGQGKRMQADRNKQFLLLGGLPVITHTLRVFDEAPCIKNIVIVCGEQEISYYTDDLIPASGLAKPVLVVAGGKERQDSVYNGLRSLSPEVGYVMIHDGARPLVPLQVIQKLAEEVINNAAVVPGVPVKDTIKKTDANGYIIDTPERGNLWQVQTPQVFASELILRAHRKACEEGFYGTDDASLVERLGVRVKLIQGSYENIKITTPDDLVTAEAILQRRAGI